MWLRTQNTLVLSHGHKVLEPRGDLSCCFPACVSLTLAMLVEGFNVSKTWHFYSINMINSLSDGKVSSACFICHSRRVWLPKRSTTNCDSMSSNGSMFNAFSAFKLLRNVFTNCLISPTSSVLIDFKPFKYETVSVWVKDPVRTAQ